ncbi:MAG: AMP-binding protein [Burkholderiales bacterium]
MNGAASAPLISGFTPGAAMGWRAGAPVRFEQFLHAAASLAHRLPPGGRCINVCEDRLNFMVGFAACLMARSVTLLPQSRAPAVLREIADRYPGACRLADVGGPWEFGEHLEIGSWPERLEPCQVPAIPMAQAAVVLFTSGTTGAPSPHAKTWGSLVGGAHALRARVPKVAGATIVGAVPPQHMWGLETTVMLPLQSGCAVHAACPLLPAEIAAALTQLTAPRWLVATPAHLRACALSSEHLPPLSGVLCSTAPLPEEIARRIEELGGASVIEIYGSTETGAIATRLTAHTQVFSSVEGIEICTGDGRAIARGGHLSAPVALNDLLLDVGRGQFTVQGRIADVVKIGGSRNSLAALTAELNRVPGVIDGAYWLPDSAGSEPRLMAFAVAPGVERAAIIGHLRRRIDPVFLPRPLVLVDALPRNAAGKLTRDALKALAIAEQDWQVVAESHPALAGHFPGDPIVPGAWLLALVERAARQRFGDDFRVLAIPAASFRAPLRPQEAFRILLEQRAPDRVAFRIEGRSDLFAHGTLVVEGAP